MTVAAVEAEAEAEAESQGASDWLEEALSVGIGCKDTYQCIGKNHHASLQMMCLSLLMDDCIRSSWSPSGEHSMREFVSMR